MNRLQKKCLIATAGFHLLLVLILVFGSAFFTSHPKPDDTQVLDVIPANLIDVAFNSGVKAAQPPAPTPVVQPQPPAPQPQPTPPQPQAVVTPPPPTPSLMKQVADFFKPVPEKLQSDDLTPKETASKPKEHKIQVDKTLVTRTAPNVTTDTSDAEAAREAKRLAKAKAKALAEAMHAIKEGASSSTTVELRGTSSVSYANYASVVKSVYDQAWTPPDDMAGDDENTKVSVTIGSDGTVISSRIIEKSGDERVDASVQRALDRVTFVAPFPEGATEKERTFIINFNPQAKRMLG
jgi:protein TonB